jgi:hypothetical protein
MRPIHVEIDCRILAVEANEFHLDLAADVVRRLSRFARLGEVFLHVIGIGHIKKSLYPDGAKDLDAKNAPDKNAFVPRQAPTTGVADERQGFGGSFWRSAY